MNSITMDELTERFQNWHLSEPKANFGNLPPEITEIIIQNSNIVSRIALRKVSRTLRELVDRVDPFCDLLILKINSKYVLMNLEGTFVSYKEKGEYDANNIEMKIIDDVLRDQLIFMKNPKYRLNHLKVKFTDIYSLRYFLDAWKRHFPFPVQVKQVSVILAFAFDSDVDEKYWKLLEQWIKMEYAQDALLYQNIDSREEEPDLLASFCRKDDPAYPLGKWMG